MGRWRLADRERQLILALAARRGVAEDTPAYAQLVGWLDRWPDRRFFQTAYSGIRAMLAQEDPQTRAAGERDLIEWSTKIAEATGGILGMMPISREEREVLTRIAGRLGTKQSANARAPCTPISRTSDSLAVCTPWRDRMRERPLPSCGKLGRSSTWLSPPAPRSAPTKSSPPSARAAPPPFAAALQPANYGEVSPKPSKGLGSDRSDRRSLPCPR